MKKRPFTMLELTCALALLALLIVMFSALRHQTRRSGEAFAEETIGILVMQNTVQQLRLENAPDRARAAALFRAEAAFAPSLTPLVEETPQGLTLALLNKKNARTVEVKFSCDR